MKTALESLLEKFADTDASVMQALLVLTEALVRSGGLKMDVLAEVAQNHKDMNTGLGSRTPTTFLDAVLDHAKKVTPPPRT